MKKSSLLIFIIANFSVFLEQIVNLPESNIKSDYIEINKMKNTKNVIVLEKKDIQEKGYKNLSDILDNIPSINVGKSGWGDIDITTN